VIGCLALSLGLGFVKVDSNPCELVVLCLPHSQTEPVALSKMHRESITSVILDSFSERANLIFALSRIMAQQALGHLALRRISRTHRFQGARFCLFLHPSSSVNGWGSIPSPRSRV